MSHSEEVNRILHDKSARNNPVWTRAEAAIQYLAGAVDDQVAQSASKEILRKITDLEDMLVPETPVVRGKEGSAFTILDPFGVNEKKEDEDGS